MHHCFFTQPWQMRQSGEKDAGSRLFSPRDLKVLSHNCQGHDENGSLADAAGSELTLLLNCGDELNWWLSPQLEWGIRMVGGTQPGEASQ